MTKLTSKWHEIWWGAVCHGIKGLYKVTMPLEYVEELNKNLGWQMTKRPLWKFYDVSRS